jgi:hypothetical protein
LKWIGTPYPGVAVDMESKGYKVRSSFVRLLLIVVSFHDCLLLFGLGLVFCC